MSPANWMTVLRPSRFRACSIAPMPLNDVPRRMVRSGWEKASVLQSVPDESILAAVFWMSSNLFFNAVSPVFRYVELFQNGHQDIHHYTVARLHVG